MAAAALQMMAAVRCKVSKWVFILRTLLGRHWDENELFYSAEEVRCTDRCSGSTRWLCSTDPVRFRRSAAGWIATQ